MLCFLFTCQCFQFVSITHYCTVNNPALLDLEIPSMYKVANCIALCNYIHRNEHVIPYGLRWSRKKHIIVAPDECLDL